MKNIFSLEAIRIADQLIEDAEQTLHGLSWNSAFGSEDATVPLKLKKFIAFYDGGSGISFFLLEVYNITKNKKYLFAAEKGMQWVIWHNKRYPSDNYAFYTGLLGVAYTLLKLFKVTKNKLYYDEAIRIIKQSKEFINRPEIPDDFLNGTAGMLLGLLHCYSLLRKPWIIPLIKLSVDKLIKNARLREEGLYWGGMQIQTKPLTGFSHGSAGIGFALLELGRYVNEPNYYFLAKQAFSYENSCYNKKIQNWPCHILSLFSKKRNKAFERAYKNNEKDIFTPLKDYATWCHGAPGIAQSRLVAYKMTHESTYKEDLKKAIRKIYETNLYTFTLCHGNGGNADVLLENYLFFKDKIYLNQAKKIARQLLRQKKEHGQYAAGLKNYPSHWTENSNLFLGIAGIGHFLLRVSSPEKIHSILAPSLPTIGNDIKLKKSLALPLQSIKKQILKNNFPLTMRLLNRYAPDSFDNYFAQKSEKESELLTFDKFVNEILLILSKKQMNSLRDTYKYELQKIKIEEQANHGLLYIQEYIQKKESKKLLRLPEDIFLKTELKLASQVEICTLKSHYIILKSTSLGMKKQAINEFCKNVLLSFQNKKTVISVVEEIIKLYKPPKEQKRQLEKNVLKQIQDCIYYGVLI